MILSTAVGDYPIPPEVALRLPSTPAMSPPGAPDYDERLEELSRWMDAAPENVIAFDRLQRWRLIQDERARAALAEGRPFTVDDDGLE